jgi:hypothetical protein
VIRVVAAAGVFVALTGAAADCARLPRANEARAIRAAILNEIRTSTDIDPAKVRVTMVRVGTVDQRYARAEIPPIPNEAEGALFVLRRPSSTSTVWRVLNYGTSSVGCGVPLRVRVDLWLDNCQGRYP